MGFPLNAASTRTRTLSTIALCLWEELLPLLLLITHTIRQRPSTLSLSPLCVNLWLMKHQVRTRSPNAKKISWLSLRLEEIWHLLWLDFHGTIPALSMPAATLEVPELA